MFSLHAQEEGGGQLLPEGAVPPPVDLIQPVPAPDIPFGGRVDGRLVLPVAGIAGDLDLPDPHDGVQCEETLPHEPAGCRNLGRNRGGRSQKR